MASRVVSLWLTNSVFIKQGSNIYFEVGFLYTGHTLNQLTDNTGEQRKDVLKALNSISAKYAKYVNGLWYK